MPLTPASPDPALARVRLELDILQSVQADTVRLLSRRISPLLPPRADGKFKQNVPPMNRSNRAFTLVELLVALAIILSLAAIFISTYFSWNPRPVTPPAYVGAWSVRPGYVKVNTPTAFTYHLDEVRPLAASGMVAVANTEIQFVTGPGATVQIVSLNGTAVNSDRGRAFTNASGDIIVIVNSATVIPEGVLIGLPYGQSQPISITKFEVGP
ncbi:MAG: type II secretion system protein [Opitutae bacterium]|nr:type II secretion system protein [Opitutae bacterium]